MTLLLLISDPLGVVTLPSVPLVGVNISSMVFSSVGVGGGATGFEVVVQKKKSDWLRFGVERWRRAAVTRALMSVGLVEGWRCVFSEDGSVILREGRNGRGGKEGGGACCVMYGFWYFDEGMVEHWVWCG